MKKNPKTVAGIAVMVLLLCGIGVLLTFVFPTAREVRREMSLTPTPIPAMPSSVLAETPDPALPTSEPILRTGSRGDEVTNLQSRLRDLGYYSAEIDGQFGAGTKEAVMAFQRANGLEPDGIFGDETKKLLYSSDAKPAGLSGN